jgi:hypothetical protein
MDKNDQLMNDIFAGLQEQMAQIDNPEQMANNIMSKIQHRIRSKAPWIVTIRACSLAASLLLIFGYVFLHVSSSDISSQDDYFLYSYQNKVSSEMVGHSFDDYKDYIEKRVFAKNTYELLIKKAYENKD